MSITERKVSLRLCPFCDSSNVKRHFHELIGFWCSCRTCGAMGPTTCESETEAAILWNMGLSRKEPVIVDSGVWSD